MIVGWGTPLSQKLRNLRPDTKRKYVMWKFGLTNLRTDYSKFTEDEFIFKLLKGDKKRYKKLQRWEYSEEFKVVAEMITPMQMTDDFNQIYQNVREKALTGDEKSIKTFLMLQKEKEKRIQEKKQEEEMKMEQAEDDEEDLILE
mgnify:CR=1 FL=1